MFNKAILFSVCLWPLVHVRATLDEENHGPRIVIVGSGASGIAAASRLLQNGFENVTILEAENRIGGRLLTTKLGDYLVDLGGQWVHGEEDNVAYELAWRLGVIEHMGVDRTATFFGSSGAVISEIAANDLLETYYNITDAGPPKEFMRKSLGEYYRPKLEERLKTHPEISAEQRKSLLDMFDLFQMTSDAGDSWFNVSAHRENIVCKGNQSMNWKDEGYSMILDILTKKFPDPSKELPVRNKTILKAEVTLIDYNDPNGRIRVSTANGYEYRADHVITTVSLGVLKADYEKLFDPPLPDMKINAIQGLQYGHVAKIFLLYPEIWWDGGSFPFFNLFWTERDKQEFANDPEKSWLLSVVTVAGVEHKPKLLSCWLSGPHAREMELMPEERVFSQIKELLHRFFGKTYKMTEPTAMQRSKWFVNKHFRGAWSYRSLETENLGASASDLQDPIMHEGNPLILFAGEATSPKHSSTVNGAIGSGWREANRLIKLYGRQKLMKPKVSRREFSGLAKIVVP